MVMGLCLRAYTTGMIAHRFARHDSRNDAADFGCEDAGRVGVGKALGNICPNGFH